MYICTNFCDEYEMEEKLEEAVRELYADGARDHHSLKDGLRQLMGEWAEDAAPELGDIEETMLAYVEHCNGDTPEDYGLKAEGDIFSQARSILVAYAEKKYWSIFDENIDEWLNELEEEDDEEEEEEEQAEAA